MPSLRLSPFNFSFCGIAMKRNENITGFRKFLFYVRMSLACAWRYRRHPSALMKASQLTRIFFKHKLKRLASGEYKLDFYLPRYPSQAFFAALEEIGRAHV